MNITQVAANLYTCRDLLKTPPEIAKTLKRLRAVGYTAVQVSGVGPIEAEALNEILSGEGLVCCATHAASQEILDAPEAVVEHLNKLHCKITAYPCPVGVDFDNREMVYGWIAKLQRAGQVLHEAGQILCYHNHSHEFRKLDGKRILELIYDGTSADVLQGEPDTYWIQYGGGDCVEWCEKLKGRLPIIHLKDYQITAENKPHYCELGAGNLNFKKIIAAAEQAGCEWFIVEQDTCPGDPVHSLAQSFRYIQENLISHQ
jgi:sugar phosphate isomerase/epimerase